MYLMQLDHGTPGSAAGYVWTLIDASTFKNVKQPSNVYQPSSIIIYMCILFICLFIYSVS